MLLVKLINPCGLSEHFPSQTGLLLKRDSPGKVRSPLCYTVTVWKWKEVGGRVEAILILFARVIVLVTDSLYCLQMLLVPTNELI